MTQLIKKLPKTFKTRFFGGLYILLCLWVMAPPLLFWGSGVSATVIGIPLSIWYWLINAVFVIILMFLLYNYEELRGETDPEEIHNTNIE